MSAAPPPNPSSLPEVAFVLELGRALQTFGTSAPTLEKALSRVAAHLGLEGAVYATPTGFLASLRKEGQHSKTYLERIEAGESDLDKLADVQAVVDQVLGGMDVDRARGHLAAVVARPSRFGAWAQVGSIGLVAGGAARVFEGGWRDVVLGCLLGLLVGGVVRLVQGHRGLHRIAPLAGALASAVGAGLLVQLVPQASYSVLVLSGLIALVPGLGLLVSMQELGTGNLVAGTARLAGTALVFLLLGFGVAVGTRLVPPGAPPGPLAHLPAWTFLPALLALPMGFIVAFRGRLGDYPWTLAATLLAWGGPAWAPPSWGPWPGRAWPPGCWGPPATSTRGAPDAPRRCSSCRPSCWCCPAAWASGASPCCCRSRPSRASRRASRPWR